MYYPIPQDQKRPSLLRRIGQIRPICNLTHLGFSSKNEVRSIFFWKTFYFRGAFAFVSTEFCQKQESTHWSEPTSLLSTRNASPASSPRLQKRTDSRSSTSTRGSERRSQLRRRSSKPDDKPDRCLDPRAASPAWTGRPCSSRRWWALVPSDSERIIWCWWYWLQINLEAFLRRLRSSNVVVFLRCVLILHMPIQVLSRPN